MKKLGIALMLLMSVFAQAQVSINVNIGTPPSWGPQGNDDSRYYYLPDIDVYYDVNQSQFIYDNNGKWMHENRLPAQYRQYDLYSGYKVVLNKNYKGDAPYNYHKEHRTNYPKGYQGPPQQNRGNKQDNNNRQNNNNQNNNNQNNNRPNNPQNNNQKNQNGNSKRDNSNNSKGNSNKGQNQGHDDRH
jgi:hypothetical protein